MISRPHFHSDCHVLNAPIFTVSLTVISTCATPNILELIVDRILILYLHFALMAQEVLHVYMRRCRSALL